MTVDVGEDVGPAGEPGAALPLDSSGGDDPVELIDAASLPASVADAIQRRRDARRHPVIPEALSTREARRVIAGDLRDYAWFLVKYHGVRVPWYVAKTTWRAPVGVYRVARVLSDAVRDAEPRGMLRSAADKDDGAEWRKLAEVHDRRVRTRSAIAVALLVALVALGWMLSLLLPGWLVTVSSCGLVAAAGLYGQRSDAPIVSRPVDLPVAHVRVTSELITRALRKIGVPGLSAKDAEIRFPATIRDIGPGWVASIDLPEGVTPAMVLDKREALASGMRRPVGCIWPDADPDVHGGRLELTVLKVPMSKARQRAWPLAKGGPHDMFRPCPFGTDQRGRPVGIDLVEGNMLVGALPGAGKTASVRVLALSGALDPTCELHVWELKGSGDLDSVEGCAHRYGSGLDDATIRDCLVDLRELETEVRRRAEVIKKLGKTARDLVPDKKVTRQLADMPDLRLHPILALIDEVQNLFTHPEHGKEAGEIAERIIRMGRAVGVILVMATQRPDANSVPTGVSKLAGIRFCLRVMDANSNNTILGAGMYAGGVRATSLTRSDRGIGYLVGATDDPVVVRCYYIDGNAASEIGRRARAQREAAGRLTGHAAGEHDGAAVTTYNLLDDLRTVFATCEVVWIWSEEACARLGTLRPEVYGGWNPDVLARNLRALGIETRQLNRQGPDGVRRNLMGLELEQVERAISARPAPLIIEQGAA